MNLVLYNSLTGKKEKFEPLEKGKVRMYSCGPTVYDYASIGNMWSYLTADILRRFLEYSGYEVRQIKNITDVGHFTDDEGAEGLEASGEDKLEKAARREKKTPLEIASHYIKYYKRDEASLNILAPHFQPRPTQEIDEIIKIVGELVRKGFAYEINDGVYFSIEKFPEYGRLSGNTLDKIKAGARVEVNKEKKHPADFAIWIKRTGENAKHTLFWKSPWGDGFPGWHIECTAMAVKYLGDSLDIHTGGEDNIFPHHECEIAQSQAYTGKLFVKYWVHTRHLKIQGEKMSKSLGNVYTILAVPDKRYQSLEERGFEPLAFRMLRLGAHYRSKANFTWQGMEQAQKNLGKINDFYLELLNYPKDKTGKEIELDTSAALDRFKRAMNDDLNTPLALASVLAMVRAGNEIINDRTLVLKNPGQVKKQLEDFDRVLAVLYRRAGEGKKGKEIPQAIKDMAQKRQTARENKDFKTADEFRKKIEADGFFITDKEQGFKIGR